MDFLYRSGKSFCWKSRGRRSRRDRHPPSEMGRTSAPDRAAQAGSERHPRGHPEIHGWQDRQMVDAGRHRVRRRHSAHRDRKDPENRATRPVQGLQFPERGGVSFLVPSPLVGEGGFAKRRRVRGLFLHKETPPPTPPPPPPPLPP